MEVCPRAWRTRSTKKRVMRRTIASLKLLKPTLAPLRDGMRRVKQQKTRLRGENSQWRLMPAAVHHRPRGGTDAKRNSERTIWMRMDGLVRALGGVLHPLIRVLAVMHQRSQTLSRRRHTILCGTRGSVNQRLHVCSQCIQ